MHISGISSGLSPEISGPSIKKARTDAGSLVPSASGMLEQADSELEARRAALRRASTQTLERTRVESAKALAERMVAEKLVEERKAAAAERAKADKLEKVQSAAVAKRRVAESQVASELGYDVIRVGEGAVATNGKTVHVKYEGRLAKTRKLFDSGSIKFRLGKGDVIRGWDQGIRGMKLGEQRQLHVPAHLGYGKQGSPPKVPGNADLVFMVTLLKC